MAALKLEVNSTSQKTYGRVVLTLENCLLPPEKLSPTPSISDGLDANTELELRILGCELIQTSGILLRLPQVAMATGQVLFQRFFYSKSFVKYNMETVAMACINLASKIEEAPRRIRDVINVFHHIKQVRNSKPVVPLTLDQNYINLKNQVIKSERRVLKELGFCVHVKHPHKIIVMYLEVLECVRKQRLTQTAWNYMTDSLRTNVFVRYNPETIACACIYLAARQLKVSLPNKPAWYLIFNVTEEDIQDICYTIMKLYTHSKPDQEKLEVIVEQAKRIQQEAKQRAKGVASGNNTPNASSFSPISRTVSPKNSVRSPVHVKKEKKEHSKNSEVNTSIRKEFNHSKKRSHSPSPRSTKSSSRSKTSSRSPTPKRKTRTPPRGYKEIRRSRTRSRSREKIVVKEKHRIRKRKHSRSYSRSVSRSHSRSPIRIKKVHKEKRYRSRSRSRSRDRNYRSRSRSFERPHKSRKDRPRDNGHRRSHSRERNRR